MIRLFGSFDAQLDGRPMPRTRTRKEQWLLALLAVRPQQALDRHWLAGLLWPDSLEDGAMANLRRSLTDLRRVLGDEASRLESPTPRTLRLDTVGSNIDVCEFDLAVARADTTALERAVELYRGPLLEGCVEEWVVPERAMREQAYIRALDTLGAQAMERGDPREAVRYLRRGVSVDPLRESVQRALMEALAAGGDAASALQVYRELRLLLHREMRSSPDSETTEVIERIRVQSRQRTAIPAPVAARAASPRHNIPQPVSSLIGRQSEVRDIRSRLEAARLVTLTGAGGVGKTRLALQVAVEVDEDYPDGVWFVELAALSDSSLLPQAIATAMSVPEEPGRTLTDTLLDVLRRKSLLLVLDNCEHMIEACARVVGNILSACAQLRVLATSREALNVVGEAACRVPSLSIPTHKSVAAAEKNAVAKVLKYDSVRLFLQRAALVRPDFRLTDENVRAVAEICGSLDGMPLAIELAAARLKAMTAEQIASRLGHRFHLLTGGSRTALPRQQTLRATLDWGYDLLLDEEKRGLRALSVFAGGWTLEAAEALLTSTQDRQFETLDLLEHLVDKSLVTYEDHATDARYHLLETVRQYSRDRLLECGETDTFRQRHRDYFLRMAEETESQLMGHDQAAVLERLEVDHDNLRAAMDYSQTAGHVDASLRMAGSLWRFWRTHDYPAEGRRRLVVALASEHSTAPSSVRAKALNSLGVLSVHQGECEQGKALFKESLDIRRALGDERGIAIALDNLGNVANEMGDLPAASAFQVQAVSMHRRTGDTRMLAGSLSNAAYTAFAQGDYVAARSFNEESVLLHRNVGNEWGAATALDNLGDVERAEGNLTAAHTRHAEALSIAYGLGDERLMAQILEGLARAAAARGQGARAARIFGFEEILRENLGSVLPTWERDNQARSIAVARSALDTGRFEEAWTEGREMTLEHGIEYALGE